MKKLILLSTLLLSTCANVPGAKITLETAGYTDIDVLGHAFVGCPRDYMIRTRFRAVNPDGQRVRGVVCANPVGAPLVIDLEEIIEGR